MVALSGIFGVLLSLYGNPEIGDDARRATSACCCMAIAFLAIGTLISSFTDNDIIASVGTLFALLLLYTIGWLGETRRRAGGRGPHVRLDHRALPGAH